MYVVKLGFCKILYAVYEDYRTKSDAVLNSMVLVIIMLRERRYQGRNE